MNKSRSDKIVKCRARIARIRDPVRRSTECLMYRPVGRRDVTFTHKFKRNIIFNKSVKKRKMEIWKRKRNNTKGLFTWKPSSTASMYSDKRLKITFWLKFLNFSAITWSIYDRCCTTTALSSRRECDKGINGWWWRTERNTRTRNWRIWSKTEMALKQVPDKESCQRRHQ